MPDSTESKATSEPDSPKPRVWLRVFWYALSIVPLALLVLGYVFPSRFFSSQEMIRDWIEGYGTGAPIAFLFLQIAQVIIAPISHYVVSIAGGFIFGVWYGFLLNYVGRVVGHMLAYFLGRFFSRYVLDRVVSERRMEQVSGYARKGGIPLFLMYFLPFFPDDELSYVAGLTKMPLRTYLPACLIGHTLGSLALAYAGAGISAKDWLFWLIVALTLPSFALLYVLLRKKAGHDNREAE